MTAALSSVRIQGFRSIGDLTLPLSSPVTLLIGANGSGKSNIVDAFELLGSTIDQKLRGYVLRSGGFSGMVHRGYGALAAEEISLEAWGQWSGPPEDASRVRNGYRMRLRPGPDDTAMLSEWTYTHKAGFETPYDVPLGESRESSLAARRDEHPAHGYLLDVLTGCRVFHFDDTSSDAPPLRRTDIADSASLHSDGRNLAAVLYALKERDLERYGRIVRSVRTVAPFFDDFAFDQHGDTVLLQWQERQIDGTFSGSALSSGTLRFICLATLFLQPHPPATIVLDEPELGLHPVAVEHLTELMRSASRDCRILAATQSVGLLTRFELDEVAVVERVKGATVVDRPDRERLAQWLDDYSLGELWEMNLLGGRPRPSDAPRRSW